MAKERNDTTTDEEISSLVKVAIIIEENGFHVIKAEEEIDNPHTYS